MSVPLISALPQFNPQGQGNDLLAASNPMFQQLLTAAGGNLGNIDALSSSQPGFGSQLSLMSPAGGINPQQAQQFGPIFGLLMSLMGGQQPQGTGP